jgi:hypothetical protein
MRLILLVVSVVSIWSSVSAGERWDSWDRGLYAGSVVACGLNLYGTRRYIEGGGHETNPVLGEHPSDGLLVGQWVVHAVVAYVIADYLGSDWRKVFLGSCVVGSVYMTRRDAVKFGVRWGF